MKLSINKCTTCGRLYFDLYCPDCDTKGEKLQNLKVETKKESKPETKSVEKAKEEDHGVGPLEIPGVYCNSTNFACKEALKKSQPSMFYVKNVEPLSVDEPFWTYYTCFRCKKTFRQTNK